MLSIGQFNQWVGSQLLSSGTVQIWPGMPVSEALMEDKKVLGVRLPIKVWIAPAIPKPALLREWKFGLR